MRPEGISGVMAAMSILADAYPHQRPNAATTKLYCEELSEYDADELTWAARTHVRAGKHFPSVAELLGVLNASSHRVPKWEAPKLPPSGGGLITQAEARAAINQLLSKWGSSRPAQRQPGEDDG